MLGKEIEGGLIYYPRDLDLRIRHKTVFETVISSSQKEAATRTARLRHTATRHPQGALAEVCNSRVTTDRETRFNPAKTPQVVHRALTDLDRPDHLRLRAQIREVTTNFTA